MTKGQMQEMLEDEEKVHALVHQLYTVGRDVRSTPMSWAYESKKLKEAVHYLSAAAVDVRARGRAGRVPEEAAE